jgi:mono/diheme cytochrome c family protein
MAMIFRFDIRTFFSIRLLTLCAALVALTVHSAEPTEPTLELSFSDQHQKLTRTELLKNPALRTIVVPDDIAYKRTMTFRALPLKTLVHDLNDVKAVKFKAADGFVATMPGSLLTGASQPWIAIEPAQTPWPPLKQDGASAGTFYLVWLSPERSGVSPEQWPYQLVAISETEALPETQLQILPGPSIPKDSAEYRGLQVYSTHCASCHRINGGGEATIGPDLNLPFNPTEYFQPAFLRRYIRNPAAVRTWPNMTMPGFPQSVISDAQLDDLLAYLRSIAHRRDAVKDRKN